MYREMTPRIDMTGIINNGETIQDRRKANLAALVQFSILFCILVVGIFGVLIISHKSFIKTGDGIKQGYFWTVELKHQMEMLFGGKGLQVWSWSKFLGMSVQTNRYWDPFNWIAAAFPAGYIELGYTIATLLRFYCGGVAFLALMRYSGLKVFSSVFGAAAYTFCGYSMVTALVQADFLMNLYLFPLLVITVEMIYKGRSPAFFSLATGLCLVSNFYCAYMSAISIILYILLRYFAYREFSLKDYAASTGRFVLYGFIGLCIGGIQFIPDFAALSGASTESATDRSGLLFDKGYYMHIGEKLVGIGNVKPPAIIGWTLVVIMLLAIAVAGIRLKKTPLIMTLILLAGTMIPAVCSMYNGFGYPAQRWYYALELFAAWTAAAELEESRLLRRAGFARAVCAFALTVYLTLGMNYMFHLGLGRRALIFMAAHLAGGAAFVLLLIHIRREGQLRSFSKAMIIVIFVCSMSASWTVAFDDNRSAFFRNNKVNKLLKESTQRAGAMIEDDSFYRIDQVDSILYRHRVKLPPNETLWWQTRSIYGYNSRVPSDLLEFNRLVGNNYGYSKRVAVISNDNRTGLDYLYGVKYFLGDDPKNGKTGSDEYAGYGFEEYQTLDGVNVARSRFDVSLGYVFDKYMSKSEYEKLSFAEREQALLQAVILPDDAKVDGVTGVKADGIKTAVKDVAFTVAESDGATLNDDTIVVDKDNGSITLAPEDIENSQLLVSVTGLLRNVSEGQSDPFELRVTNEYIEEIANNNETNQTIPGVQDYTLNMGYYDRYSGGKIKIRFSKPGTYTYDDIRMTAMDAALFDECIGALSSTRYKISSFSDTEFEGTVDTEKDGILFLSILEPERWECYIDGEKAEIIRNTDLAFTGVRVPAGHHSVTLRFHNRMADIGIAVSIAGLIMLAAISFARRRRGKK